MLVRRIGGLQFVRVEDGVSKRVAQETAKGIRKGGYNARVIKSGKKYAVWREVV